MNKPTNLAVHRSRLPIDYEQGLIGWRDHVVAEHSRGCDGPVRRVPLSEGRVHGSTHSRDHLHFPYSNIATV
jgi:hypothetical protein